MAAIDFPASPTNNQVFVASNGVTYIWSSAYTAWQAQPLSAGYVGDFMATWTSGFGSWPAGTEFTMVFPTIFTGNAGGWYSTSNGRYTPPRGRYKVSAGYSCYSATAAIATQIKLRKNGADILPGGIQDASTASNQNTEVHQELILDLNGTDYIEVRAWTSGVPSGVNGAFFTAFPIAPNVNMTQGTGDFYATTSNAGLTASYATVLFNTILTGNASGAYASGTGRFTPPAGRYFLTTTLSAYWTAASTQLYVKIRKNGVDIPNIVAYSSSPTNSTYTTVTVQATVDASGTDYFDVHSLSTSGASGSSGWFGAYPISGIQGPPGPPPLGSLSLYSEKVCVGGETLMDVTIPPNCKRIELEYAIQAAAGDPATLLQAVQSGVPNASAAYSYADGYALNTPASGGGGANSQTAWNFNGARWNSGTVKLWAHPSTQWTGTCLRAEVSSATRYVYYSALDGPAIIPTTTGWRLSLNASSFVAGSFLRCYVVT